METGLSQLSGADFLVFYACLMAIGLALAIWLGHWLRPDGRELPVENSEELAVLAGGAARHAEAVAARLLGTGAIEVIGKHSVAPTRGAVGHSPAEKALTGRLSPVKWDGITGALKEPYRELRDRLVDKGLLVSTGEQWQLRALATLPLIGVLALGAYRYRAGAALGEPVEYLTLLMAVTGVLALLRFFIMSARTRAGEEALAKAREQASRLKRAPLPGEAGTAVALFGTAVLVGTPFAQLHAMRQASGSDGGGSSSSDGGSGCGGGGCGGCGG